MSQWRDEEGYEAGKEEFDVPERVAGCFLERCFTLALPCVLIGLFVF